MNCEGNMTYRRAVILVAVLMALVVAALLLRDDIAGVIAAGDRVTGRPADVLESSNISAGGNVQERLSNHTARFWDIVGEGK